MNKVIKESEDSVLSPREVNLFKYVNKKEKLIKDHKKLLDFFKEMMPVIGNSVNDALYYYKLYVANYRPEGDYENLTISNLNNKFKFKGERVANIKAKEYAKSRLPFKGSNLEGYWGKNSKGEEYYVIVSYDWYPIYLYINKKWYKNNNGYSISTKKQMRQVSPEVIDANLNTNVELLSTSQIKEMM